MAGRCFSSNLGANAVQCNPQDVSGTQRYKFFATALTNHKESVIRPKHLSRKSSQQSQQQHLNNKIEKVTRPLHFENVGTQTVDVKVIPTDDTKRNEDENEQALLTPIQMEKIKREEERKQQEKALPPVTDKESLEAYRIFLEENERKDFALREKELDVQMEKKLQSIEEKLYNRYTKDSESNQKKIEVCHHITIKCVPFSLFF